MELPKCVDCGKQTELKSITKKSGSAALCPVCFNKELNAQKNSKKA